MSGEIKYYITVLIIVVPTLTFCYLEKPILYVIMVFLSTVVAAAFFNLDKILTLEMELGRWTLRFRLTTREPVSQKRRRTSTPTEKTSNHLVPIKKLDTASAVRSPPKRAGRQQPLPNHIDKVAA